MPVMAKQQKCLCCVARRKQVHGPSSARKEKRRQKRRSRKPAQWMFWTVSIAALLGVALSYYCHFNEHRRDPGPTINVAMVSTNQIIINQPQKMSRP